MQRKYRRRPISLLAATPRSAWLPTDHPFIASMPRPDMGVVLAVLALDLRPSLFPIKSPRPTPDKPHSDAQRRRRPTSPGKQTNQPADFMPSARVRKDSSILGS